MNHFASNSSQSSEKPGTKRSSQSSGTTFQKPKETSSPKVFDKTSKTPGKPQGPGPTNQKPGTKPHTDFTGTKHHHKPYHKRVFKKPLAGNGDFAKKEAEKKKILWRKAAWKKKPVSEFKFKLIQVKRVTKVTKGGRMFRFLAVALAGNGKGKIGFGTGKGNEVVTARQKAFAKAEKAMWAFDNPLKTIPHEVSGSFCSSKIILKPASEGTGILVGGSARTVMELLGLKNVRGKSLGSNNKINLIQSTLNALKKIRNPKQVMELRDLKENPLLKSS